jgi:hypothetical protein
VEHHANPVLTALVDKASGVLDACLEKIEHCLKQLSDDQVWRRPGDELNSIGNLILHLTGNVRQWLVAGIGGVEDVRDRPSEFAPRTDISRQELLSGVTEVVHQAKAALASLTADSALSVRRIQGFDVTAIGAIFDSVPHFQGHTQEIICLTRMQLGAQYAFHWRPESAEQGAPD